MPEHHMMQVGDATLAFHVYVDRPDTLAKLNELQPFFARMPASHLQCLWPFFVMQHKPARGPGGGTWGPDDVRGSVMGRAHSANTGIPDADIEELVASRGLGMMGIPLDRWSRRIDLLKFTVMHEAAHCIDFQLGLVPAGATAEDFPGMQTNRCGAGNAQSRRAVEAYARCVCRPWKVYHVLEGSLSGPELNRRNIATLRRSPAFAGVAQTWPL